MVIELMRTILPFLSPSRTVYGKQSSLPCKPLLVCLPFSSWNKVELGSYVRYGAADRSPIIMAFGAVVSSTVNRFENEYNMFECN